jgi:hypothetical protein
MLNFNDNELQTITKGLSNLPWIEANPVINKIAQHVADRTRRAALPDPFEDDLSIPVTKVELNKPIVVPKAEPQAEKPTVSRKAKRAALMRILKSKGSADLSTAEIARRSGVSYVTAAKARAAFAPKKGRK